MASTIAPFYSSPSLIYTSSMNSPSAKPCLQTTFTSLYYIRDSHLFLAFISIFYNPITSTNHASLPTSKSLILSCYNWLCTIESTISSCTSSLQCFILNKQQSIFSYSISYLLAPPSKILVNQFILYYLSTFCKAYPMAIQWLEYK